MLSAALLSLFAVLVEKTPLQERQDGLSCLVLSNKHSPAGKYHEVRFSGRIFNRRDASQIEEAEYGLRGRSDNVIEAL